MAKRETENQLKSQGTHWDDRVNEKDEKRRAIWCHTGKII